MSAAAPVGYHSVMRYSALIVCAASVISAQTFEVASVMRSGPDSGNEMTGGPGTQDPIRFRYTSATIEDLVVIAYNVEYDQVTSRVSLDRDHFDVTAKVLPGTTKQQFRVMLQNLLVDRFRLRLRTEVRQFSGYALTVAKSGLKSNDRTATGGSKSVAEGFPEIPPGKPGMRLIEVPQDGYYVVRLRAQQMPISELARGIHVPGERPIVDETGLPGKYDFTLEYAYAARLPDQAPEAPPVPSIFTALQTQLGLQLVAKRVALDVLVVESFSRVPSEN
jgi:uncharacterized protein (TIGR03435 family)